MSDTQIIPAIDASTEEKYAADLKKIEDSGAFEGGWVHIDLSDGEFTDWETVGPEILEKYYPTNLKREVHLMVKRPQEWILKMGEVDRVIIHVEIFENADCLAINPETQISVLDDLNPETVLVMGVHPGKQGQDFVSGTLEKVKEIRERHPDVKIGVDGGITLENAKLIVDAGADNLVIGSHLIEGDIDENLEKFWEALHTES